MPLTIYLSGFFFFFSSVSGELFSLWSAKTLGQNSLCDRLKPLNSYVSSLKRQRQRQRRRRLLEMAGRQKPAAPIAAAAITGCPVYFVCRPKLPLQLPPEIVVSYAGWPMVVSARGRHMYSSRAASNVTLVNNNSRHSLPACLPVCGNGPGRNSIGAVTRATTGWR